MKINARFAILALLVAAGGCQKADSFALVHVNSTMPIVVSRLHVTATIGLASSQHDVRLAGGTFPLPPERTFGIEIPSSYGGTLNLHVDAYDDTDQLLLSGDAFADISAGERKDFNVLLGGQPNGGPDLAGADLSGQEPADLAGADLTGTSGADLSKTNLTLSFMNLGNTSVSTNPQGVAIGDLNGDGKLDVAVACYTGGNITTLLGNNMGGLSPVGNYGTGGTGQGLAIADVTGDGKADVVAATIQQNLVVMAGAGNGALGGASPISLTGGAVYSIDVAIGTLNADTIPDIAVAGVNNTSGSKVAAIVNNPAGTFGTPAYQNTGNQPSCIKLGDTRGVGKLDLLQVNSSSTNFSVFLGGGDGTIGTATNFGTNGAPDWLVVGDFDNDTKLDVVVSSAQGVEFFKGAGNGSFTGPTVTAAGMQAHSVAAADFDKDGKLDVVVTNYIQAGGVTVLLGTGDGHFTAKPMIPTGANPLRLAVGDLKADGLPDIVVANASDNNVTVLANNSN